MPCRIYTQKNFKFVERISLLTVNLNLFLHCLVLFNNEQLAILYLLLDDDRQVYQNTIRQQYAGYKY